MSFIAVKITGGEREINLQNGVSGVEVILDTIDEKPMDKSKRMIAKIVIKGEIRSDNTQPYLDIFNWSKEIGTKSTYRVVEVTLTNQKGELYRRYEFGEMFVEDYSEDYVETPASGSQPGNFELSLIQRDDCWDSVLSFDN